MKASPVLCRALRRIPLSTKQGGKDFYKGTGTGSMGNHTKDGKYVIDYAKVRTYMVPNLAGFELTPFVSKRLAIVRDSFKHTATRLPTDGKELIKQWKAAGGID